MSIIARSYLNRHLSNLTSKNKDSETIRNLLLGFPVLIYTTGFVIVNAYLSERGATHVLLIQPSFVSAGILFVLLLVSSFLFTLPLATIYINFTDPKKRISTTRSIPIIVGLLSLLAISILLFSIFIVSLIYISSPDTNIRFSRSLLGSIFYFSIPECLFSVILTVLWRKKNQVARDSLKFSFSSSIAGIIVLFIQIWSILWFAGNLYSELSPSLGGGKPVQVRMLVDSNNKEMLKSLGIQTFTKKYEDNQTIYFESQTVLLFWQLSSYSASEVNSLSQSDLYIAADEFSYMIVIPGDSVRGIKYVLPNE